VKRHRAFTLGFTLIEVMVAAAVLGIAATALFSLLSRSLFNMRRLEDVRHYELAGEEIMNRVLLLSSLPPRGRIEGELKNRIGRWAVTVTPWIPDKLVDNSVPEAVMKINVEILWPGRSGERTIKLESLKAATLEYNNYDFKKAIENALPD